MAEQINSTPLVSIVVITYNSSEYVLETLGSIKSQTYKNIELVISDDCSADETVSICQEWVEENKQRFVRTEIVEVEKNTGVAPNCNRGLRASKGKWVKLIAGDDLLVSVGLENFVSFVGENSDRLAIMSAGYFIGERSGVMGVDVSHNEMNSKQQLKSLLLNDIGSFPPIGPTGFVNREMLIKIGGFDESYPMIEDFPLTIKVLDRGHKIYVLDKPCVKYRINKGSISTESGFSKKFIEMYETCGVPVLKRRKLYFVLWHWKVRKLVNARENGVMRYSAFRYLVKMTSPYAWLLYFKKQRAVGR